MPLGSKSPTDIVHLSVAMPYGDSAGMQQFVDSVSNPSSPNYRKFLTPDEVGMRFGLQAAQVDKVRDYLISQGMNVRLVGKNRLSILADASVSQAQAAFNVSIQDYLTTLPGESTPSVRFSATTPPCVPATLVPYVQYIGGLENFVRPTPTQQQTPDMLRTLYSVSPLFGNGFQGQGRTVAITNWVQYGLYNVPLEYAQWNLPTPPGGIGSNITVVSVDGSNGNVTGGTPGECDIDIQTALAMAPLCNLILYDNANNSDLIGVLTQEADDNKADLISESYAWNGPTQLFVAAHNLHLAMSAQGITYLCASGDWGATGVVNLYYPDEDPEVFSIGGTSVNTDAFGNRSSEVVWDWGFSNGTFLGGGGGWAPNSDPFNLLPSYQTGNGVPTNIPFRLVPDITLDADPNTGYQIFLNGGLEGGWGGTSCASPTTAGALADCEQMIIANGGLPADAAGHRRFGRINDLIYSFNGDPTVFYDVVSGNNGLLPDGTTSNAVPGWDTASGWGAMIFSGFVARVLNYPEETSLGLSENSVVGGGAVTATVTFASPVGASTATLNLSSNSPVATVPASITVTKGATSATFPVSTIGVSGWSAATISATLAGSTKTALLTIAPANLQVLALSPSTVVGGNLSTGTVTLNGQAASGGTVISLASSDPGTTVPSSVTIPQGETTASFTIMTSGESSALLSTITANFNGTNESANLTVEPAALATVSVDPTSVNGGNSVTGAVTLTGMAPTGGVSIKLSATKATVPSSVTIPSGSSSASFTVTTKSVTTVATATITANSGQATQSTSLTIQPAALESLSLSPTSVVGGSKSTVTGTITLTGPAPSAGVTVTLTSSSTKLATAPGSVRVVSGSVTATFTVTHKPVASPQTVTITAKYGSTTQQATLTLQPAGLASVSVSPTSVKGSASNAVTGTVTLSGPAPVGGLLVTLLSSDISAASVPTSVMITGGASSATFRVSHKKVTSSNAVTITASLGQATATTTLTVTP